MDFKKRFKKIKEKQKAEARQTAASLMHVYRSTDINAPFENWERITKEPIPEGDFTDEDARKNAKFYYYKLTMLRADGSETAPVDSNYFIQNGKRVRRSPENSIMGSYLYWSTDPNLPLAEWNKVDELITDENASFQSPVREDFYVYSESVNFLGKPLQRSPITKVIYKGK